MNTLDYIEAIKARHNVTSAYAVAKLLGLANQTVLNWKNKGTSMDEKAARKVAHLLDLPEAVVLMDVTAEKARTDEAKALYQGIADALRDTPVEALPPALRDVVDGSVYIMLSQRQQQQQLPLQLITRRKPARPVLRLAS